MRSPVRRPVILAISLALLLGATAAGAPATFGAKPPPNTKVAGIDVDATTIPQLQALMNRHRLTSVAADPVLPAPDQEAEPEAQRGDHGQPDGAGRCPRRRQGPPPGRPPAAARHPDHRQGQHQHDRHAHDRRLVGPRRQHAGRRLHRPAAQGRRRDRHRQGQPVRVGELPVRPVVVAAGAASAARPTCPTCSTATRAARAPGPASSPRPISPSRRSGPRPTARSSARPAPTASSASSRRWASSAGRAIVPISADQDTAGPMTRNVTDAAVLLGAMTGIDPNDAGDGRPGRATRSPTTPRSSTPTRCRARGSGSGASSAYEIDGVPVDEASPRSSRTRSTRSRRRARPSSTAPTSSSATGPVPSSRRCCASSRRTSRATSRRTPAAGYPKTLQDLIDFNNAQPGARVRRARSPTGTTSCSTSPRRRAAATPTAPTCASVADPGAQAAIDDLMARADLDAIIAPTNGPAWVTDPVNGDLGGDFSTFVGVVRPVGRGRLRADHGPGRVRRPAARRGHVHRPAAGRSPSSWATPTTSSRRRTSASRRSSSPPSRRGVRGEGCETPRQRARRTRRTAGRSRCGLR